MSFDEGVVSSSSSWDGVDILMGEIGPIVDMEHTEKFVASTASSLYVSYAMVIPKIPSNPHHHALYSYCTLPVPTVSQYRGCLSSVFNKFSSFANICRILILHIFARLQQVFMKKII